MTKDSTNPSKITITTTPCQALKQARLIGLNDHVKSVRQKTAPNSAHGELKQVGLAAFGFGNASSSKKTPDSGDALETPPPKRQKRLSSDAEVPETQFAQNTQSPELDGYGAFAGHSGAADGSDYSSPLSSPPSEGSSPFSINSINSALAMLPPPLPTGPVTPKRRRAVEVPDSKSPPFTPFTPYRSQREENQLEPQVSPTARLGKSLIVPRAEEDAEMSCGYHSPTPKRPQGLFSSTPKSLRQGTGSKGETQGAKGELMERGEVVESAEAPVGDREEVIDSSQWWENEDTQNASISTQYTLEMQIQGTKMAKEGVDEDTGLPEPGVGPVRDEASFRVDLSYKGDPPLGYNDDNAPKSQDASQMDDDDAQESFRSMTYPIPLKSHDGTPQPETGEDPVLPVDEGRASSTASEEEDLEDRGNESQEYPEYRAYRTQQLPSSFYQQPSSPEFPPSSQYILPEAVNQLGPAGRNGRNDNNDGWEPQLLPETLDEAMRDERDKRDSNTDEEPSQFLPKVVNEPASAAGAEGDRGLGKRAPSQFLPGMLRESNAALIDDKNDGEEQDIKREFEDDDGKERGAITRSQLLPGELMETFPMPPPLSQYSSYGYGYHELDMSETQ